MDPRIAKERLWRLLNRQHGRVTRAQLRQLGISDTMVRSWLEGDRMRRVLPKVYAVGHRAESREADLWAAVLYAGPEAMLSHRSAAHWRGLIDYPPRAIEVSTPRRITSTQRVTVYCQRSIRREFHHRLPVASVEQTVLDVAAVASLKVLRRVLANLDYRGELDPPALMRMCRRGRPGSARLRQAIEIHQPQLARTNGPLEQEFLVWCERHRVPIPIFNAKLHGIQVDAYWPAAALVIELDGHANHSSKAQLRRDRRNELTLRRRGITVLRYDWELLHRLPRQIHGEIMAILRRA